MYPRDMYRRNARYTSGAPVAMPTAQPIAFNHDGLAGSKSVPSVNKVYEILPVSSVPAQPWNGSLQQIEFEFPRFLGKVIDNVLQFEVLLSSIDPSGSLQLLPTTGWFSRIEILYNAAVVETVEPYDVHTECVGYSTDQELNIIASSMNLKPNGNLADPIVTTTAPQTLRYYLPLYSTFLATAQPYIKGFRDTWRVRLTFAQNIVAASAATGRCRGERYMMSSPPMRALHSDVG